MERFKEIILSPITISILIILIGVGAFGFFVFKGKNVYSTPQMPYLEYSSVNNLPYDGKTQSKVIIEEYGDFQCPACLGLYQSHMIDQVQSKYKDKVKFTFRNFPLVTVHPYAFRGAEAALAAGAQGKFWEMYNKLYQSQAQFGNPAFGPNVNDLVEMAKSTGVTDIAKFEEQVNNDEFRDAVDRDVNRGTNLGVNSTPTIYINGQVFKDNWTVDAISPVIDKIISSN